MLRTGGTPASYIVPRARAKMAGPLAGLLPVVVAALMLLAPLLLPSRAAATPLIRTFPVCTDASDQYHPDVASRTYSPVCMDRIVWQDWRNASGGAGYDIYSYDLATNQEIPMCTAASDQRDPAVSGAAIWRDGRLPNPDMDLWGWQLDQVAQTYTGVPIDTLPEEAYLPDTDINTGAWVSVANRNVDQDEWRGDVRIMWFPDGSTIRIERDQVITDLSVYQSLDGVSPVIVTWSEWADARVHVAELRRANSHLELAREYTLPHTGMREWAPDAGGGRIVFVRTVAEYDYDLVSYDLRTGKETVVYRGPRNPQEPSVSGDLCVFAASTAGTLAGELDIYGCNLKTKTVFKVCTAPEYQESPAVSGSIVVWEDGRNDTGIADNGDIQAAQVDTKPPRVFAPRKATVKRGAKARLAFKVKDNKAAKAKVTIMIKKGKKKVKRVKVGWRKVKRLGYARFRCKLKPGTYRFYVSAVDEAGNPQKRMRANTLIVR